MKGLGLLLWAALWASPAWADSLLRVGFGLHKPPYAFENEPRGIDYEIIDSAARLAGFRLQAFYAPQSRLFLMLKNGQIDALSMASAASGIKLFYSQPYVFIHNEVAALASRHIELRQIGDMSHYSVSSFQSASSVLGAEYLRMAQNNPHYREESFHVARNRLLYSGRVDLIVAERHIFAYANQRAREQVDTRQPLRWYDLLAPTPFSLAFTQSKLRERFDQGLTLLKTSGNDQRIIQRYLQESPSH